MISTDEAQRKRDYHDERRSSMMIAEQQLEYVFLLSARD